MKKIIIYNLISHNFGLNNVFLFIRKESRIGQIYIGLDLKAGFKDAEHS